MKTILPLVTAAAFIAFLILPISAEIAGSALFAASLALVISADYGRRVDSLPQYSTTRRSREALRLAA
jgi:hypothetical protein